MNHGADVKWIAAAARRVGGLLGGDVADAGHKPAGSIDHPAVGSEVDRADGVLHRHTVHRLLHVNVCHAVVRVRILPTDDGGSGVVCTDAELLCVIDEKLPGKIGPAALLCGGHKAAGFGERGQAWQERHRQAVVVVVLINGVANYFRNRRREQSPQFKGFNLCAATIIVQSFHVHAFALSKVGRPGDDPLPTLRPK